MKTFLMISSLLILQTLWNTTAFSEDGLIPLNPAPQPIIPRVALPPAASALVGGMPSRPPIRPRPASNICPSGSVADLLQQSASAASVGGGSTSGGGHTNGPLLSGTSIEEKVETLP